MDILCVLQSIAPEKLRKGLFNSIASTYSSIRISRLKFNLVPSDLKVLPLWTVQSSPFGWRLNHMQY